MAQIDREQLFRLAGIVDTPDAYTPATVGKKNKLTGPRNVWFEQFRNLTFTNTDELRAIAPENVTRKVLYTMNENGNASPITGYKAFVGDDTKQTYAIHSDRYKAVQHSAIIDAMAYAADDTSLSIFGHTDSDKGRFNGYATIANPDVHVSLGDDYNDAVMMGMRFYNSHLGDCKFGGEIFGIRQICGNFMAVGNILGKVSVMHYKNVEDVASKLGNILRGYVDKIDTFKGRVHYIRDTKLNVTEQEAVLWGLGLADYQIQSVMTYRNVLNPEIKTEDVSAFDLYNATTAFITYRVGGDHMVRSNLSLSERVSSIFSNNIDQLIDRGERAKQKYIEEAGKTRENVIVQEMTA